MMSPEICLSCGQLLFACGCHLPSRFVMEIMRIRQGARDICNASPSDLISIMADYEPAHLELLVAMFTGFSCQVHSATEDRLADEAAMKIKFG